MNIGDKVRMLKGREEGIITAILSESMVEMAIEGDFRIPVARKDLVVVSAHEAYAFGDKKTGLQAGQAIISNIETAKPITQKGIFAAFEPLGDQKIVLHLINNTEYQIAYTLGLEQNERFLGSSIGILQARQAAAVHHLSTQNFEQWPAFVWQFLYYKSGFCAFEPMVERRIRIKNALINKNLSAAPTLNLQAWVFQLDKTVEQSIHTLPQSPTDSVSHTFTAAQIKESMMEKPTTTPVLKSKKPLELCREVDLHIEKIVENHQDMPAQHMLDIQKQAFEKQLDQAVFDGVSEIIFIHGIGNGILRAEIHKQLSKSPHVSFYKDARKEKFGFGATHAQLK